MRGELQQQRRLIEERLGHYQRMLEKNGRAVTILDGCLDCGMDDHHRCVLFRRHPEVPEAVPCDRWGRASELLTLPTASD